jgi:hypothetical protein
MATTKKTKGKKAPAKGRRRSPRAKAAARGVGDFVRELLHQGLATDQIVEQARAQFPGSKVGAKEVHWYAWHMRQRKGRGEVQPARRRGAKRKPAGAAKRKGKAAAAAKRKGKAAGAAKRKPARRAKRKAA